MILPNIKAIGSALGIGLLVGSLGSWYLTAEYKDATWSASVAQLQIEAADSLQVATVQAASIEREAGIKVRELEAKYHETENNLAVIRQRNRVLADQLGGLRDPGRRTSGHDTMPGSAPSSANHADPTTSAYLSAEASGVLLDAAAEVDGLASYAKTCYDWSRVVVTVFEQPEK